MSHRLVQATGNVALSLGVSLACLALAEGWARLTEPVRPPRPLGDTRAVDWDEVWSDDFYVMRSYSVGWPPRQAFNRDGVRDRRHPREKLPGIHRLIALGDSVTFGYGFEPEEAWPQVLSRRLVVGGEGIEVFNVALPGWSTRQERYAYERIARPYRPDTVVLGICLNDVADLQNNLSRPPRVLAGLFRRSAFVRRLADPEGREIASVEELFDTPAPRRVRHGYRRLFAEIRRLRAEVERDGARLVLLLFPEADQVGPAPHPPRPQEQVTAFARAEGLPLVDPLPELRAIGPGAFFDRLHLTPQGSSAVVDAVLAAGVVPVPPGWAIQAASWSPAVPDVLGLRDPDPLVRFAAARALGQAGVPSWTAREGLFRALGDESETVRWAAADALAAGDLADPGSVGRLVVALESPDGYVRGFAAWALARGGGGGPAVTRALAARVRDEDPGVRTLAVRALGNLAPADAVVLDALQQALLRGVTGEERWRAARALAKLGPDAAPAVDALTEALAADESRLRREAALALGRVGTAAAPALPRLVAARRDDDEDVRAAAEKAIRRITARRD